MMTSDPVKQEKSAMHKTARRQKNGSPLPPPFVLNNMGVQHCTARAILKNR
jgi:hypothetical protein